MSDIAKRTARVIWYKEKIGFFVVPLLERATGKSISQCRILSIGTGGGEDIEIFRSFGIDAFGIDVYKENTVFWRSEGLQCLLADGRYLPFKSSFFDCVIAIEVIEHVGQEKKGIGKIIERKKFAKECMRVSSEDGVIFLSTPNKNFPFDLAHSRMSKAITGGIRVGGLRLHQPWESFTLSLKELKEMFNKKAGDTQIFLISPLGYINWNFESYTKSHTVKYVFFPIAKLWLKMLDSLSSLRVSPLNPHLIVIVN